MATLSIELSIAWSLYACHAFRWREFAFMGCRYVGKTQPVGIRPLLIRSDNTRASDTPRAPLEEKNRLSRRSAKGGSTTRKTI